MVKHVYYKKASDRLYLAFAGEMDRETKNFRRRELRQLRENSIRKAEFVSEYVQCKYHTIYSEAEELYVALKNQYPSKNDLKKTPEYIVWKNKVLNIEPQLLAQDTSETSEPIQTQLTQDTTETIRPEPTYTDRFQLEIPLINYKTSTKNTHEKNPKTSTVITEVVEESVMDYSQETVMDLSQEIEDIIQPPIFEEIPAEQLQQIINELTLDPYLENILNDLDLLGIDLGLDDQCPLENELNN